MKSKDPFILAAAFFLCVSTSRSEPPQTLAGVRVFAVYEPVLSRQDVEILSRVHPDFVCRGWFKWHHTPDWQTYAPLAQACAGLGIQLQGGITLSSFYPCDYGMSDAAFRDFATHGTDGQPYHCRMSDSGGWYQLSLYNPKVVETLKREARLQIDAGAAGLWYDEIEGYYDWNPTEGYDPYACAAFRDWLVRKYCVGQGWREDDPRWRSRFGIDLAKHGGSIRTFDYLLHLRTTPGKDGRPLAENPPQGHPRAWAVSANPLYREWGFAWDRKAAGTFRFDTAAATFDDILTDADRYAREKYGRALVNTYNHNGTARPGVAFLQPHNGAQPPLRRGRFDGRVSYLSNYENLIADAAEVCPGQPVVFFVDWPGETDRLTAMSRADQTHFFSLFIPEAYAAGGEFALPLRGYSYVAANQGTLGTLARLADFYREYAPFLRNSKPSASQPEAQERLTLRARTSAAGTALHIVNHAFSAQEVWPQTRTNLCVRIPWNGDAPDSAFAVSPDFPDQRPVRFELKGGALALDVGDVACSALVLLPEPGARRAITGTAAEGAHILDAQGRALAVARGGRFTLWLPPENRGGPFSRLLRLFGGHTRAAALECLETGERQPARAGAAFAAPAAGGCASGLLLDAFGIPARHAEIAGGGRRWHTDAWGRFHIPLADATNRALAICVEPGSTNTFAPDAAFTAWRFSAARRSIGSFGSSLDGYWANWPDKERSPGAVTLARDGHQDRSAMKCIFAAAPRVPWSNVNSPGFTLGDAGSVEIVYAGDGTPRTVYATLHAPPRFYRFPLSLAPKEWTVKRLPVSEFRDEAGRPFDPAAHTGNLSFQLAPAQIGDTPATVWLHGVTLINDKPVQKLWQSQETFDAADVDNLRAGHQPQPSPPAVAKRQPLVRFTEPKNYLANWADKSSDNSNALVTIERVAPAGASPFLRVTFPAGECAWGNANIPFPAGSLKGQDGLALRLRTASGAQDIELALHVGANGQQTFYKTDIEAGEGWVEQVLPWTEFRADSGQSFAPERAVSVNLQLCRPPRTLTQRIVIDIAAVDAVSTR